MKTYASFCPVAKTAEIFAERWTPLLLRELMMGARRFSELQTGVPLISRALLASRLAELERSGIIVRATGERGERLYMLTPAGEGFRPVVEAMSEWGQQFGDGRITPGDIAPDELVWGMRRHLDLRALPEKRLVVQFEFGGLPRAARAKRYWWLVLNRPEVDVCIKHPGFEVDVTVVAQLRALTLVWLGFRGFAEARRAGEVAIAGEPRAVDVARTALGLRDEREPKSFDFSPRPDPFGPVPVDHATSGAL